jgi:hypothetical protein
MICDVCCHATDRSYSNSVYMGRPDVFCFFCFLCWYEEGLVQEEAIRHRSIEIREEGWPDEKGWSDEE